MKYVIINNNNYELKQNYKDAYNLEDIEEKMTDYFDDFDYIVGDYAYGKLRLKGFCNKENKHFREINDIEKVKEYIRDFCAYDCKYFILEKLNKGYENESK
mgnify:CR=1 FL=1